MTSQVIILCSIWSCSSITKTKWLHTYNSKGCFFQFGAHIRANNQSLIILCLSGWEQKMNVAAKVSVVINWNLYGSKPSIKYRFSYFSLIKFNMTALSLSKYIRCCLKIKLRNKQDQFLNRADQTLVVSLCINNSHLCSFNFGLCPN